MMGTSSFALDDFPQMCFNNAKNWELGWYSDRQTVVDVLAGADGPFNGTLVGISDYLTATSEEYVTLKIENGDEDLFIGFNKKAGINNDTQEAENLVTIQSKGEGYVMSSLVAKLDVGDSYEVGDYLGTGDKLAIYVDSIGDKAMIHINSTDCGGCCSDSECILAGAEECAIGICNQGNCTFDTSPCVGLFELTVHTDRFPTETTYKLIDDCEEGIFNVYMQGGPYEAQYTTHVERTVLPPSQYTLTFYDQFSEFYAVIENQIINFCLFNLTY